MAGGFLWRSRRLMREKAYPDWVLRTIITNQKENAFAVSQYVRVVETASTPSISPIENRILSNIDNPL